MQNYYYFCLAFLVLPIDLVWWIVRSPWGRAFKAFRDNPARAASLGVDIRTYTLLAFSIGAGLAGVAGALYARLIEFIDPRGFYIGQSFDFFLATVVGGLGTLVGPFIGRRSSPCSPTRLRIRRRLLPGLVRAVRRRHDAGRAQGDRRIVQPAPGLQNRRREQGRRTVSAVDEGEDARRCVFATSPSRSAASRAVDDVSFDVHEGEILGVIGPNGCGKTTLFNCILGQYRPDDGHVDSRVTATSAAGGRTAGPRRAWRRTFQLLQVFQSMSVRDNLRTAAQEHIGSIGRRLFKRPTWASTTGRPAHRAVPPGPSPTNGRQPQLWPAEVAGHGDGVRVRPGGRLPRRACRRCQPGDARRSGRTRIRDLNENDGHDVRHRRAQHGVHLRAGPSRHSHGGKGRS